MINVQKRRKKKGYDTCVYVMIPVCVYEGRHEMLMKKKVAFFLEIQ